MKKDTLPLLIILNSIIATFLASRVTAYLILNSHLPARLFASVNGFRLHHFVYGNISIVVTSFLAIGLGIKKHRKLFALMYGIGMGLVLDEFLLWMGDIEQLTSNVMFIPYSFSVIIGVSIIIGSIIIYKQYAGAPRSTIKKFK